MRRVVTVTRVVEVCDALLVSCEFDFDLVEESAGRRIGELDTQVEGVHDAGLQVAERAAHDGQIVVRLQPTLERGPCAAARSKQ